jgi:type IV secretion system protein TrbE
VCGASSPEDQKLIERVLATLLPHHDPDAFARAFLEAKGLAGVGDLFDALSDVARAANDQSAPPSNDFTSPLLEGLFHVGQ